MHWVSGASVAVKIGFAADGQNTFALPTPHVLASSANSAWF
jgi:hypothetical protein